MSQDFFVQLFASLLLIIKPQENSKTLSEQWIPFACVDYRPPMVHQWPFDLKFLDNEPLHQVS